LLSPRFPKNLFFGHSFSSRVLRREKGNDEAEKGSVCIGTNLYLMLSFRIPFPYFSGYARGVLLFTNLTSRTTHLWVCWLNERDLLSSFYQQTQTEHILRNVIVMTFGAAEKG
jgi:hypothetical protein